MNPLLAFAALAVIPAAALAAAPPPAPTPAPLPLTASATARASTTALAAASDTTSAATDLTATPTDTTATATTPDTASGATGPASATAPDTTSAALAAGGAAPDGSGFPNGNVMPGGRGGPGLGGGGVPVGVTPAGEWGWPLAPRPVVVRRFAVGPTPWSPGHRGVDLAARPRQAVLAPADGTVRFAGFVAGRPVLTVDHGAGLVSSFEPVASDLAPGAQVRRGDPVGQVTPGPGHCLPQTCLHWGVRRNGVYVDPLGLVAGPVGPPVLLPVRPADLTDAR